MEAHDTRCISIARALWRSSDPAWPVAEMESANPDILAHQLVLRGIEDNVTALAVDLRGCASTRDVTEAIHKVLRTELFVPPDVGDLDDSRLSQIIREALLLLSGEEKLALVLLLSSEGAALVDDIIELMPPLEKFKGRATLIVVKDVSENAARRA